MKKFESIGVVRNNLDKLTIDHLLALGEAWTTEGHPAHDALMHIPELAVLLPQIKEAYALLREEKRQAELYELLQEGADSARHCRLGRSIFLFLEVFIDTNQDTEPAFAQRVKLLQQTMFPHDLQSLKQSYEADASSVADRITRFDERLLATLEVSEHKSLLQHYREWLAELEHAGIIAPPPPAAG